MCETNGYTHCCAGDCLAVFTNSTPTVVPGDCLAVLTNSTPTVVPRDCAVFSNSTILVVCDKVLL